MLTPLELASAVTDPSVVEALRRSLGLPDEPVAAALRQLTDAVRDLAAAQARTDATVKELAAAQARTDATVRELATRVDGLATAQARTEASVRELASAQRQTQVALGALSDNVGFGLEELATIVLPGVLERQAGVHVSGFERRFVRSGREEVELDLYGAGERDGGPVVVAGEVKSRIYRADVESFRARLDLLGPALGEAVVPVMFGFVVHPSAREAAHGLGVHVIASRPGS